MRIMRFNDELIKIALQEFHDKDYLKQIIQKETGEKKLRDYHKLYIIVLKIDKTFTK